jgi:hypothetical protein
VCADTYLVHRRDAGSPCNQQQHQQQLHGAAAHASRADIIARCKPQLAWSVAVVFLLLPFLEHHLQPPQVMWKLLLVASE